MGSTLPSTTTADDYTINLPPHRGPGVTKTALWASWKEVRGRARALSLRDIVDFAEFDIEPEKWINQLLSDLQYGRYQPAQPQRFALAKSKGFSRWMTQPDIRDVVLFHCLATRVAERASHTRRKPRHVYFMRDRISKAQQAAEGEARALSTSRLSTSPYLPAGKAAFPNWLRFHQYRRYLLFKKVYPFIVSTDITNFFDSVAHSQLEACLYELGFPRAHVGLLLVLLERLSIRDAYAPAPRIGLPVDEFDCSRCLAHVVLFQHDDRMVDMVGEDAYVRWMDDQTFGLADIGKCYRLLAEVNASLRRMHLTPNSAKTKVLTLAEARREYHFVANDDLDGVEKALEKATTVRKRAAVRKKFLRAWTKALKLVGVGEWNKIAKRSYRLAARLGLRTLVRRAHDDVLSDPSMADSIARYLRCVSSVTEFVSRARAVLADPRNVYDDVRRVFAEELLRLEPGTPAEHKLLRSIAKDALTKGQRATMPIPRDIAALLVLRFGTKHSLRTLKAAMHAAPRDPGTRAIGLVLASYGDPHRSDVADLARTTLHGPLPRVTLFLRVLEEAPTPDRLRRMKNRIGVRKDPALGRDYIDMRALLQARLMRANARAATEIDKFIAAKWRSVASTFEEAMLRRLFS